MDVFVEEEIMILNTIIISITSAIIGAIITGIFSIYLQRRKEKREEKKEDIIKAEKIKEMRPELSIVSFKNYLKRLNYGINIKCDIELFVSNNNFTSESELEKKEWCCVIYTLKNTGKTDISFLDIICSSKYKSSILPISNVNTYIDNGLTISSYCYDKKIKIDEIITLKLCYYNEQILYSFLAASMMIGIKDINNNYWIQSFFSPYNKLYESIEIKYEKYLNLL